MPAIAAVLLSGCFAYHSAPLETVSSGQEVRVYLARNARVELPNEIPADRPFIRGRLMQQGDASFTLRVPIGQGGEGRELGQDIRIDTGEVLEIQRRELDMGRSALLVAGAAAVAAAVIFLITDEASSPQPPPGPSPDLIRIPLFSVPTR